MRNRMRERVAQVFGALSHPTRLRMLELLADGPQTVNYIATSLEVGQSGASQHLSILLRAGVVIVEPQGTARLYRLRGPRIPATLALIEEFCEAHMLYDMTDEDSEEARATNVTGGSLTAGVER